MNPSPNETGLSLPAPMPEQAPVSANPESAPAAPEQAPAAPERAPAANTSAAVALPAIPLPLPTPPTTGSDVTATSQSVVPSASDDTDLIEKEWVHRAKQIVERTRDDPYKQSEELTVVRADYLKQRYDKSVKLSK